MSTTAVRLVRQGLADDLRRRLLGLVVAAGTRPVLNGVVPLATRRRALDLAGRISAPVPKGVEVEVVDLGGVRTWRLTPRGAHPGRAVLALHGGGYNYGGLGTHGGAYGWLARELGVTTWMPDYRLVPEHPQEAPLEDALAAWRALAADLPDGAIAVTGDSAGAHLALGTACEVRDGGLGRPACLLLHSPWVDADPSLVDSRPSDRILHRGLLRRDVQLWLGDRDPADPLLSPIRRDLHDLPPTLVQWGRDESLTDDATALVAKLESAGVGVTAEPYPDLWHDAMLHVPALREARLWLARTAAFAADHLAIGEPADGRRT